MPNGLTPFLGPLLQGQPLFLVEPIHQVLAHLPAFASQQHQDLAISVAYPALRNLPDAGAQFHPLFPVALVTEGTAVDP